MAILNQWDENCDFEIMSLASVSKSAFSLIKKKFRWTSPAE